MMSPPDLKESEYPSPMRTVNKRPSPTNSEDSKVSPGFTHMVPVASLDASNSNHGFHHVPWGLFGLLQNGPNSISLNPRKRLFCLSRPFQRYVFGAQTLNEVIRLYGNQQVLTPFESCAL